MAKKDEKPFDMKIAIKEAVNAGLQAGYIAARRTSADTYKATEKRLYAYPILLKKITDDKERLNSYLTNGAPERSKSVIRFNKSGIRLTPNDILKTLTQDLNATIATDEYEVESITSALKVIEKDAYYPAITGKFIDGKSDEEIAALIPCDTSTVRRNRGRLIRTMAVWLYGAAAI
jgi:hypothetical protein